MSLIQHLPPQIFIAIIQTYGIAEKVYTITASEPKVVIDLTADLAAARSRPEIISAQFRPNEFGGNPDDFYQHCINILSKIFISYTYEG
jgi:hypothetical protein